VWKRTWNSSSTSLRMADDLGGRPRALGRAPREIVVGAAAQRLGDRLRRRREPGQ